MKRNFEKAAKQKKKIKWWQILIVVLVFFGLIGSCNGTKSSDTDNPENSTVESAQDTSDAVVESDTQEDTSTPSESTTDNPLLRFGSPEFFDVMNGSGTEVVSTRAYMTADKEPFSSADGLQFEEFCSTVAAPALESASWLTVDFGDGTGLNFSTGLPNCPTYCYIDDLGRDAGAIVFYTIENGTIKTEHPDAEASENPPEEQEEVPAEEMVWIASTGDGTRYHKHSSCSSMDNPIQIPLSEALARGYTACQKNSCYG